MKNAHLFDIMPFHDFLIITVLQKEAYSNCFTKKTLALPAQLKVTVYHHNSICNF